MSDSMPRAGNIQVLDRDGLDRLSSYLKLKTIDVTLLSSGWTEVLDGSTPTGIYTQSVTVPTLQETDISFINVGQVISVTDREEILSSQLTPVSQNQNAITFEAVKEPSINIPIIVTVQGEYNHTPTPEQNP